jgi:hypothetical protein
MIAHNYASWSLAAVKGSIQITDRENRVPDMAGVKQKECPAEASAWRKMPLRLLRELSLNHRSSSANNER